MLKVLPRQSKTDAVETLLNVITLNSFNCSQYMTKLVLLFTVTRVERF